MLSHINGYNKTGRLGYFYGDNAFVSIAIASDNDILINPTGVVDEIEDLKQVLSTEDADIISSFLNQKGCTRVDGTEFVSASLEEDYLAAYASQMNLKRVIETVQNRAVVLGISEVLEDTDVEAFLSAPTGVTAEVSVPGANLITILIERATVFDKDMVSFQGVPTADVDKGRLLIDDLNGLILLSPELEEVKLLASSGNYAIKIFKTIPALS